MEKQKILLVVPRLNMGGAETYVATVAMGLRALGAQVHVASGGGGLARILQRQGIAHHFVPVRLSADIAACFLERIVRRHGIGLIHANAAAAAIAAVKVKARLGIPVLYTAHGLFGHNAKEMTLRQCDRIICVSEFTRRYEIERGFDPQKLVTMYTGIALERFQPDPNARRAFRAQMGLDEAAFTIALVARMKSLEDKGQRDILRIFRRYAETKNWRVLVAGTGKEYWKFRYLVWKNGLGEQIRCLGQKTDVAPVLNAADALALPSRYETFGLVLVEAMAMHRPTVAYDVGGTAEIGADGITGYWAKYHDIDDFFSKLRLLAADREKARQMGQRGRAWAEKHCDSKAMLGKLTELYAELLARQ